MVNVRLVVDPVKLRANVFRVASLCSRRGIDLTGVTKGICADPLLARGFIEGGAKVLADSRLSNLERLVGCGVDLALLRIPALSEVEDVVRFADISFNTEVVVLKALANVACRLGKKHQVMLMIDLGEGREGILPQDAYSVAEMVLGMPGLTLRGIGANFTCLSGVAPTVRQLQTLVDLAEAIYARTGVYPKVISGGNSSSLPLVEAGEIPQGITDLRIGEAILCGWHVPSNTPINRLYQDVFTLLGEVIEVRISQRGIRAVISCGWLDVDVAGLVPRHENLQIVGASSDHLVLSAASDTPIKVGDYVPFSLNYQAIARATSSTYVSKEIYEHSNVG
ncbi:MAG: alanine racemase [Limnochordia bacterium]|jgi:predicted amino acid racemase|nr:alanine racemase [Limnochordia bacterium]MDD2628574.1 alanine racemase [Limnochordia bacterium]MDD4517216.1 alanine racemase [Limnochordia bacterium]